MKIEKRQTRGDKRARQIGRINIGRALNRKTLHNWGIKGSVPVNKAYRDVKQLVDQKDAQQYFNNQFYNFSNSRSRSRSRSSSRSRKSMSN
jgi:hypothetical protein